MIPPKLQRTSHKHHKYAEGSLQPHMAELPYNPNSFLGNGTVPSQPVIIVRAEEALIVVLVLVLWVGAIALFFNRWGKIRMLEPYQPKFIQQHRPSCPLVDPVQHRSFSKFNISGDIFLNHQKIFRPRQNSVFVGSSMMNLPMNNVPRKVKSAFDLQNLVLSDPALNRSALKINYKGDYFRRSSLFPACSKKSGDSRSTDNNGDRRLSFKDLVDIERFQRCERVQCHLEKEPSDVEGCKRNRKIGETKQRSTISTQSSLSESRHNSITNQDLKPNVSVCSKLPCHDRRCSLLPVQREVLPRDLSESNELRPEVKSGVSTFRRNSMLLINSLENERNLLNPRENIKSGVIDFRRNSMLIINNLTEDIGYRSIGRNFSLGGSNIALGADFPLTSRRNSVIPPYGYEAKHKLSVPHVSVAKSKSGTCGKTNPLDSTDNKYISNHKPSKSLDIGDTGKVLNWRSKKEVSQPSLVSEAKKQFLMPTVPQNFVGSSASLNIDYTHQKNISSDESQSTGNLVFDKSDFNHPKIIETKCFSPNEVLTDDLKLVVSSEDDQPVINSVVEVEVCGVEDTESKTAPTVNITTSLTNLNITSSGPVNIVTSSDSLKTKTNAMQITHV